MIQLKAVKCPSDELALTNCAIVNQNELKNCEHLEITGPSQNYVFTLRRHTLVSPGQIGFSAPQRKWAIISVESMLNCKPYKFDSTNQSINVMTIEIDFAAKKQ